jgi:LysR family transcriptional regulator, nod-box dependent transcriptional activator
VAPSFLSIPGLLIGTNRIATIHRRLATRLAAIYPILVRETPLTIPPIREAVQWDIANNNDPAIRWVVERLVAVAMDVPEMEGNVVPITEHQAMGREFMASSGKRGG